ncbi:glycosyltransferase family 39 protein [Oscillochloris sp. ZM17-4]|uniref:glycosyltransferase family 39 protein n=1 Tax=Oscillochloris sp. ZM17-4 TaxID=2866714 RepID=UPI001C7347FD|nr:glycosyltransferase family 39 protein [Oscillochloris sp. ZM17-4]MBX0327853.1 glycosyltransferase family 39 protein [Oscillochloris sp. ZM17-4]
MATTGPHAGRAAAAIVALLLGVYLLTTGGHLYAIDEEMMYDMSDALGARGVLYLNDPGPAEPPVYSTYGPGQSIVALPLFWAGELLARAAPPEAGGWVSRAAVGWLNPVITALLAALVYRAGRRLAPHRAALLAALAYGLGSTAWPYTKTFFAEPLTALLWFASFMLIWRPAGPPARRRALLLAGLLAGMAPAVKIQAGLVLPILGLYALYEGKRQKVKGKELLAFSLLPFALGAALPLLALAIYNTVLFGSPLRTGYGDSIWRSFSAPFWEGFGGQIWGLRRGLIWCMPLSLLAPLGLSALWRRDRAAALLCLAMPLSQLLFYATWYAWDGAGAWGPRFLNAAMPFIVLPLAALAADPLGRTRWLRAAAIALAVLTIPVQAAALSINMNQLFNRPAGDGPSQTLSHIQLMLDRIDRLYQRHLAADRLVLWAGFAPSEGAGERLLPRWTLPAAELRVRPPAGAPTTLTLAAHSCWAAPEPTRLSLRLSGATILSDATPCPGRVYRLLLPPGASRIALSSPGWEPAARDRTGRLGVYIADLSAAAGGRAVRVEGDRLPAEGMPAETTAMRVWMGDVRLPLWDYWWAYLPLLPYPAGSIAGVGVIWASIALICLLVGAALAGRGFLSAGEARADPPPQSLL